MREPIYEYDPARALDSPDAIALFLADALQTKDTVYIANAFVVIARAKKAKTSAEDCGHGDLVEATLVANPE